MTPALVTLIWAEYDRVEIHVRALWIGGDSTCSLALTRVRGSATWDIVGTLGVLRGLLHCYALFVEKRDAFACSFGAGFLLGWYTHDGHE